jgi:SAM-dependent methyltransferase
MSSYEIAGDFGALYDAVPIYQSRADVPFYLAAADRVAGGRVLELGCGTGRVLLPLARAGYAVTGIDASPAMLARCRSKLTAEPAEVRERVVLHQSDIRAFDLDGRVSFALALAPFRVLQHLLTPADQLQCLALVRRHLDPSGRLVFDVFNPSFSLMTRDRSAETEDTPERALPDGRHLRRTARVTRVRWIEQVIEVELIYYLRTGATVERLVQSFAMRWYGAAELAHLLARAGFRVDAMYGDSDGNPLRDESPDILVVATRVD